MSASKDPPKEVKEMHNLLAEVRKSARGVKESARNLRTPRKGLTQLTEDDMKEYDSKFPPRQNEDPTVRRSI